MRASEFTEQFRVKSRGKFRLRDHDPRWAGPPALKALKSEEVIAEAKEMLEQSQRELSTAQELLYANDRYSLLIVLQGMDASGKDGERRGKKGEGDQKGQTGPAPAEGGAKSGSEAKSPP